MEPDLIQRAREGDEVACERLVRQYQDDVFRLAYLLVGDADDAQDVAQETFIRALRNLRRFDESRPLRPWLLQITRHLASNRRRDVGRYFAVLRRFVLLEPEKIETAENVSAQRSAAQALWSAVRQLRAADQEVIYLRYFLELSVSETAEVLKVEDGTVKSRLSRALGRLRGVVETDFPLLYEGRQP